MGVTNFKGISSVKVARPAWGKFDAEAGTRHHLAHHCADVAACFARLIQLPVVRSRLTRAAGTPLSDMQLDRLAACVPP